MHSIEKIGVKEALRLLLPGMVRAGEVAMIIQRGLLNGSIRNPFGPKDGERFSAALTPADPMVEDLIGADVLRLFDDAGFFGEEHDLDRVSAFFQPNRPFTVTLDPINGTLYFATDVPQWDSIATICRGTEILGAIVYHPYTGQFFIGVLGVGAFTTTKEGVEQGLEWQPFVLEDCEPTIQINFSDDIVVPRLKESGFKVVSSRTDFVEGDRTWTYATHGILTGTLCGIVKKRYNLIDSGAVQMIAREAGGVCAEPEYDPENRKAECMILGANQEVYKRLVAVLAP